MCEVVRFTVFTPTFNRGHTLHRVYESLLEQTCTDFEWLVIDDGSTDQTCNLIAHFQKCQKLFPIVYHALKSNHGKHIAHNTALKYAQGELTAILDSDDAICPNTLERCWHWWETVDDRFSGIDGLAVDQHGRLCGDLFPHSPFDSQWNEHKFRYRIRGEHWGVVRTDVLREFPFPDIKDDFLIEGLIWGPIGKKYLTRAVNEVFRVYYR